MKNVKNVFLFFLISILIFFGSIIYENHFSSNAQLGQKNMDFASSIKKGMKISDVAKIMGIPNSIQKIDSSKIVYSYISNNIDYLDIEIYFDKQGKVYKVFLPEN